MIGDLTPCTTQHQLSCYVRTEACYWYNEYSYTIIVEWTPQGVLYEWTLNAGVIHSMEAVGDGGGTTKTQVTLEVQLQLITEINQWLVVMKNSRVNGDHKIFSRRKDIVKLPNRKCPGHRQYVFVVRRFWENEKCRPYREVVATLSYLQNTRTSKTWQSQTSNLAKTRQSILVS
jgi:hypothetical protein